jgi:hypothetical protein
MRRSTPHYFLQTFWFVTSNSAALQLGIRKENATQSPGCKYSCSPPTQAPTAFLNQSVHSKDFILLFGPVHLNELFAQIHLTIQQVPAQ